MGTIVLTTSNAAWPWSDVGGATVITVEGIGAGGGGGGENGYPAAGGGGGGGGYAKVVITKGAESTLDITVGAAGTAGSGGNGGAGGYTRVLQGGSGVLLAQGGGGGGGGTTDNHSGSAGTAGTAVTGTTRYNGGVVWRWWSWPIVKPAGNEGDGDSICVGRIYKFINCRG